MASNVTGQSMPGETSADHLKCTFCSDRFKEPKLLNCFHSFCLKCLQDLKRRQDPDSKKLTCPLCRQETLLQDKEVADLPTFFTLGAQVKEFTLQEQLLKGQGSKIKCQACKEGNRAISVCMDCDHFLCQECQKQHGRMAVMMSHKVFTMAQLQTGEIIYKSKLREKIPQCRKHQDLKLNIYCNTCQQLVCTTCSLLDHGKHDLTSLSEAGEKCKQTVAALAFKAEKYKTELILAMDKTDRSRKKLEKLFADTHMKISIKAKKEIARIKEEEQKLKEELEKLFKERLHIFETSKSTNMTELTMAEHKLDGVKQLKDQGSSYEILHLKQRLVDSLRELTRKQPETVPDKLPFMEFEEGERSLGRLVLKDDQEPELQAEAEEPPKAETLYLAKKWQLKTKVKTFGAMETEFRGACVVTTFPDGQIVVLDAVHKQLIASYHPMNRFSVRSETIKLKGILGSSISVSTNKDNHLIVLRGAVVQIFDREYYLFHQFKPGRRSNGKPTCLAVDENNLIAVGFQSKREVSLHRPDGSLFKTLHTPMIGGYLTTNKQRLIYTNFEKRKLLSVDYNGNRVFSVDIPGKMIEGPTGVTCDSDGSIYVAIHRHFIKGGIYQFSPEGKYLRCVIEKCGSPCGITFTPDGELVVAAEQSVQIYHRV